MSITREERYGVTQEWLQDKMEYKNGELYWRYKRRGPRAAAGERVGGYNDKSRRVVMIHSPLDNQQRTFRIHRLIWTYHNGSAPDNMDVHHIDDDKTNNHIENLGLRHHAAHALDHVLKSNPGKLFGVRLKRGDYWHVYISKKYFDRTKDFFEACCMRKSLEWAILSDQH